MRLRGRADRVRVIGDEDGYHLLIETEDGDEMDFRMDHEVAEELAFAQTVGIRLHFQEGELARRGMPACSENGILGFSNEDIDLARDLARGK